MADIIDLATEREKRRPAPNLLIIDETPPKTLPSLVVQRLWAEIYAKNFNKYPQEGE